MKSRLTVLAAVVIGIALWWLFLSGSGGGMSMSPSDFVADHNPDGLILDVRTGSEHAAGHLEGAVNINVFDSDFRQRVEGYPRDEPVYLYCGSGQRSGRAAGILMEMGFEEAYNIGGYNALRSAGASVSE